LDHGNAANDCEEASLPYEWIDIDSAVNCDGDIDAVDAVVLQKGDSAERSDNAITGD
jgi:hypothetical protein